MTLLKNLASCTCGLTWLSKVPNTVNLQFVRFRKPRWAPKAPTKMYRVREPTPIDPVEYEKMKTWTNLYNTQRKSLHKYIFHYNDELEQKSKMKKGIPFEDRLAKMNSLNDKWSEETARIKEADMFARSDTDTLRRQTIAEREILERKVMRDAAEARVSMEMKLSGTFVGPENLDEEVEKLLNTRADFEFALNVDGTTTKDSKEPRRETIPTDT